MKIFTDHQINSLTVKNKKLKFHDLWKKIHLAMSSVHLCLQVKHRFFSKLSDGLNSRQTFLSLIKISKQKERKKKEEIKTH